ncbi:MAG: hypothetical protein ACOX87_08630 [Chloroflexota bacterium]
MSIIVAFRKMRYKWCPQPHVGLSLKVLKRIIMVWYIIPIIALAQSLAVLMPGLIIDRVRRILR